MFFHFILSIFLIIEVCQAMDHKKEELIFLVSLPMDGDLYIKGGTNFALYLVTV